MFGYLLVLATVLAGQVDSATDPYGTTGQGQPGADNQSAPQSASGLVPNLESEPADSPATTETIGTALPTEGDRNPNGASAAQPGGNERQFPFGASPTSPATSSPPPGYGGFQPQSPPPVSSPPPANAASVVKSSALMRTMLTPPAASRLSGERVTLAEVVAGATSRAEQSQRVDAYWDLCSSVADYYLGLAEQHELQRLRSTVPRIGPTWGQAEKELAIRIGTSERAARASQQRVASFGSSLGGLPLPGDMPHCGSYHSHYGQIFAGRPSREAQELSALLPLRYAELKDAAMAVARAEEWLNTIASMRSENSDGTGTLRALELWALRRRAFVQIARDYNGRIARYAELATPGQVPAERLIGMLILREDRSTATRPSSPTSSNRQSSRGERSVPKTFSGGWSPAAPGAPNNITRDDAVEPASAELQDAPRQERSLLVKPR